MSTNQYGNFYWCVKVTEDVSADGEIYVMADEVQVNQDGSLLFIRNNKKDNEINLIISAGKWNAVYAASLIDGSAVAVEHWANEINRSKDGQ